MLFKFNQNGIIATKAFFTIPTFCTKLASLTLSEAFF